MGFQIWTKSWRINYAPWAPCAWGGEPAQPCSSSVWGHSSTGTDKRPHTFLFCTHARLEKGGSNRRARRWWTARSVTPQQTCHIFQLINGRHRSAGQTIGLSRTQIPEIMFKSFHIPQQQQWRHCLNSLFFFYTHLDVQFYYSYWLYRRLWNCIKKYPPSVSQ